MEKQKRIKWLEEMIIREEQELDYHRDRLLDFKGELREVQKR